jgi:hypothetical protein
VCFPSAAREAVQRTGRSRRAHSGRARWTGFTPSHAPNLSLILSRSLPNQGGRQGIHRFPKQRNQLPPYLIPNKHIYPYVRASSTLAAYPRPIQITTCTYTCVLRLHGTRIRPPLHAYQQLRTGIQKKTQNKTDHARFSGRPHPICAAAAPRPMIHACRDSPPRARSTGSLFGEPA